jgi:multidrug transporter EmrE-like cation transporter
MSFADIVALSVIEVYGDFSLRFYAQTNKTIWLANGLLGYVGVVYYLIKCFREGNVLYVNGMWDSISTVIESLAAFVILGDRLNTTEQYVGLALVVTGIFMLKK